MCNFYCNFALGFSLRTLLLQKAIMQRTDIKDNEYQDLLRKILKIFLGKGLKSTTMDSVAAELGMSKRTLYEIFDSKSEMIKEVLQHMERENMKYVSDTFAASENVMEAFITIFKYNRDFIKSVNVDFYRDMDRLYKDKRKDFDKSRENHSEKLVQLFNLGVEQGMFRPDVDFYVQARIMGLQMEALKRVEELFPPDITLQRVFDAVMIGSLRSIASPKGMKILDKLTEEINN